MVDSSQPCDGITRRRRHQECILGSQPTPSVRVFDQKDIPSGKDVWRKDSSVRSLAMWYSIVAYVIVVGVALLSSRSRKGVAPPKERVRANALIAIGVTIVAIGSTALVRYGRGGAF